MSLWRITAYGANACDGAVHEEFEALGSEALQEFRQVLAMLRETENWTAKGMKSLYRELNPSRGDNCSDLGEIKARIPISGGMFTRKWNYRAIGYRDTKSRTFVVLKVVSKPPLMSREGILGKKDPDIYRDACKEAKDRLAEIESGNVTANELCY